MELPSCVPTNDLAVFDLAQAMNLRDAIKTGILDVRGRRPSLQQVQRWANESGKGSAGCRPLGSDGPRLVLPSVLMGRERLVMRQWVEWFVRQRQEMLVNKARAAMPKTVSDAELERRGQAAAERMRKSR